MTRMLDNIDDDININAYDITKYVWKIMGILRCVKDFFKEGMYVFILNNVSLNFSL